jgi:hypothetical protein
MRMGRLIGVLAIAAFGHGTAVAQTPVGDSAVGSGGTEFFTEFHFDVRGGPSGESPTGTATLFVQGFGTFELTRIDCLSVTGSTATFTGPLGPNGSGFTYGKTTVVDGGAAGAGDTYASVGFFAPTDCSPYLEPQPLITGDIVVVDAQPFPTSKDQCTNGGWQSFGVFKNQGDCVSFVATGGKNPPASSP